MSKFMNLKVYIFDAFKDSISRMDLVDTMTDVK